MPTRNIFVLFIVGSAVTSHAGEQRGEGLATGDDTGYDVLVFAPETPVIVRVQVQFDDGVTIRANRRTYAEQWFGRLDRDESGVLDGDESPHVPSFGRFDDVPGEMHAEWPRLDTAPQDGRLSDDELFRHVDAAMGSGLSVKRPHRPASQTVILHPRLDIDDDGQVSADELAAGLTSLSPFDFDDDESLSAAELQPFPRAMRTAAADVLDTGDAPFVTLDDIANVDDLTRRLAAQYGRRTEGAVAATVTSQSMGIRDEHFTALDRDSDGTLNEQELATYLTEPRPDAKLTLHFPRRRLKRLDAGEVRRPEAVVIKEETTRRRLMMEVGGLNVDALLQDARGSFESITARFRATQFGIADRDNDQQLTAAEFGRLEIENITFTAVDADRDERVSKEEFLDFVELRSLLAQCRVEMTVENETISLFDALDTDEDLRLSPREFERGAAPLLSLDRNGNGKLAESELVTKYTLEFAVTRPPEFDDLVGSLGFNQMGDETRLPIVRPVTRGPQWFRKMDRNQDGDVTWREFLGPKEAFDRLDTDGNGLIDDAEASP